MKTDEDLWTQYFAARLSMVADTIVLDNSPQGGRRVRAAEVAADQADQALAEHRKRYP